MNGRSISVEGEGEDELELLLQRSVNEQWGDGLPFIPPTEGRVDRALAALSCDPEQVLGIIQPSGVAATVRMVVVNAVMAGCAAEHVPLVCAAVEAMCDPRFNVFGAQVTTHPVAVAGFVSGPAGALLGVNASGNASGPGNRANATIGRAIRLVLLNLGHGIPGTIDKATFGMPGKYSWFFGENQAASPWPSFAERVGAPAGESVVVVLGAGGYLNLVESTSSASEMLRAFATSVSAPNSNDFLLGGEPYLILCPEHAELLAAARLSVDDVQTQLWELARLPVSAFSDSAREYRLEPNWSSELGPLSDTTMIPISKSPDDIRIVVSGGPGRHSAYLPGTAITPSCWAPISRYLAGCRP